MKTLLIRAEKEKINFMVCNINSGTITADKKGKLSLESATSPGEKYQLIMCGLSELFKHHTPHKIVYRSGQGFRGNIDEVRYANEAMLNYFSYAQNVEIDELTQAGVRKKLNLKNPEFKALIEKESDSLIKEHGLAKSDKIIDSLVFFSLLRGFYM